MTTMSHKQQEAQSTIACVGVLFTFFALLFCVAFSETVFWITLGVGALIETPLIINYNQIASAVDINRVVEINDDEYCQEMPVCHYCGNKFIEDRRGRCASCGGKYENSI